MNQLGLIILTILTLTTSTFHAHKDRIERPIKIQFIFENKDTINLTNKNDSLIKYYSREILERKRKLISAKLTFKTGEIISLKFTNFQLVELRIERNKKKMTIPQDTIDKIKEIHFQTIALLWDGKYKKAFNASYFYVRFDMGTTKFYGSYPYVKLSFKKRNFSKGIVWTPIDENSKQRSEL